MVILMVRPIDSALTDGDTGLYTFADILAISYVVVEEQPC